QTTLPANLWFCFIHYQSQTKEERRTSLRVELPALCHSGDCLMFNRCLFTGLVLSNHIRYDASYYFIAGIRVLCQDWCI
ncbi:hypothetical protein LSH36_121g10037, partial [Paralvinella palmiformis]